MDIFKYISYIALTAVALFLLIVLLDTLSQTYKIKEDEDE